MTYRGFDIEYEMDHVVILLDGKFVSSADTAYEAKMDIDALIDNETSKAG